MTYPNASPTPEVIAQLSDQVYADIALIDPERNPVFTAFEQIKGTALATLFLEGYTKAIERQLEVESGGDPVNVQSSPLDTAITNFRYVAGYYVSSEGASEQLRASLEPWNKAAEAIRAKYASTEE